MKAVYWFSVYLLIGIWSVIAPYALSFTENSGAFWSSLLVGALLVLISAGLMSGGDNESQKAALSLDLLQRYNGEIRRYPILDRDEECRLAREYKDSDNLEAGHKLITSNLRLVVNVARHYRRISKDLLDLIQEGNMGLIEALRHFDPYRGIPFRSYATWWVRAYIVRYAVRNWRMVKVGTTAAERKLFFNLEREKQRLAAEGRIPGPTLLSERLGVNEQDVVEMEKLSKKELSMDELIGRNEKLRLVDCLPDERQSPEQYVANAEYQQFLKKMLERFAQELQERELLIFKDRLMTDEPVSLREVGQRYNISRERVRQIEQRVKKKLKTCLSNAFPDLEKQRQRIGRLVA